MSTMADTSNASVSGDAAKVVEEPTRPANAPARSIVVEAKPINGDGVVATGDAAQGLFFDPHFLDNS